MKIFLTLLVILFWSCSNNEEYDLFKLDTFTNYQLISLDTVNDIENFNSKFWSMDSLNDEMSFVAKFDFNNAKFDKYSNQGIKLEGLPYLCLIYDCRKRNTLRLDLNNDYQIVDYENNVLDGNQIKELVKSNILNYGKNPSLSDEPKFANVSLFLDANQKIDEIAMLLKHIVDGYLEILTTKEKETGKPIKLLTEDFPLNLYLRQVIHYPDIISADTYEEIEDEVEIDLNLIIDTAQVQEN